MRRQDRAVTAPEKIRAVIDACEVCRLGLQDGRGVYVVPVNFGHTVEGGRHVFYFHGAAEGRKVDLVRRNGWAGFELDTGYRLQGAEAACGYTASARVPSVWWRRRKRSGGVWRLSCARLPAAGTGPFRTRRWTPCASCGWMRRSSPARSTYN